MSIIFRRRIAPVPSHVHETAPLAFLAGIGALAGLGLAAVLYLTWQAPVERPPPESPLSLLESARPEPATLGGMGRALAALERDLTVWHRLVAPQGPLDLGALRDGLRAAAPEAVIPPASPEDAEAAMPAPNPDRLVLAMLAVMLAAVTLVAGLSALLLERMLLGPFRAMRSAAAALADGDLDTPIPGTARDDEAGILARALERFRVLARTAQAERESDPASLAEAGLRLEAAARQIECAAAAAAALVLEASLDSGRADAPCMAQEVWDLSHRIVTIRAAAEQAVEAIERLAQGTIPPGDADQPEPLRILTPSDAQ